MSDLSKSDLKFLYVLYLGLINISWCFLSLMSRLCQYKYVGTFLVLLFSLLPYFYCCWKGWLRKLKLVLLGRWRKLGISEYLVPIFMLTVLYVRYLVSSTPCGRAGESYFVENLFTIIDLVLLLVVFFSLFFKLKDDETGTCSEKCVKSDLEEK